ncbi:response regulator transcription factor [Ruminococcaceae bacterium OttesenSCG-928-D13]|nr:response regulator transcription factor [Ruminococcaceae bacterium OttesenSCG-928-D13]
MEHRILIMDVGTDFLDDAIAEWRSQGFESTVYNNMRETLIDAQKNKYHLVMITMRQVNRDEILEHLPLLRDIVDAPIVVLSTEHDTATKVLTLNSGANEYTLIPCTVEEGVATGLALIRMCASRGSKKKDHTLLICDQNYLVSIEHRKVFVMGRLVDLSYLEFEILRYLMEYQGKPRSYRQIFSRVWGEEYADNSKATLWAHIKRLREKLQVSPELPEYIKTVRGHGYSFDPSFPCDNV